MIWNATYTAYNCAFPLFKALQRIPVTDNQILTEHTMLQIWPLPFSPVLSLRTIRKHPG